MSKTTKVALVLDSSGSMSSVRLATVSTYNEQVEQLQINAREGENILASLLTFNGNVYEHLWNVPAADLQLASAEGYNPQGGTNIWDAMGHVIDKWEAEPDHDSEDVYHMLIVISDGEHGNSSKWTAARLNEKITALQKTGRWTPTFLGCDKNYLERFAQQTGIPISNMGTWSASNTGAVAAASSMRGATAKYFSERKLGKMMSANFYSESAVAADFTTEQADAAQLVESATQTRRLRGRVAQQPLHVCTTNAVSCCMRAATVEAAATGPAAVYKLGTANVFGAPKRV